MIAAHLPSVNPITTPADSTTVGEAIPLSPPNRSQDDLDQLGDQIAQLAAHIHAATHRLLELIAEFDRREGWGLAGFRTCAHWLSWRTGIALGAAREKVRVARALTDLPLLSDKLRRGELSYSKVRALTRVATPENEEELLGFALAGTASHVERLVRTWRRLDRIEASEAERARHASRFLTLHPDDDGMWTLRGRLDPEVGAVLTRALEVAAAALFRRDDPEEPADPGRVACDSDHDPPTASQRAADAIGLIAERAIQVGLEGHDRGARGRADRYQVMLHVQREDLASGATNGGGELEDGMDVSAETSRRLSCDASRVVMREARAGRVLDVGRRRRTVPPAIRRALERRDLGCRFPGCGVRFTDAHHVKHWADGGATRLDNLVLLCRRHHRAVHEEGFGVEVVGPAHQPDFRFVRPDGMAIPNAPKAGPVAGDILGWLQRVGPTEGVLADAALASSAWAGEVLDLEIALDGLRKPGRAAGAPCWTPIGAVP